MTYFDNLFSNLADFVSHSILHDLIAQGLNSKCFTCSSSQQTEALASSPKEENITFDSDSSSGSSSDDEAFHE